MEIDIRGDGNIIGDHNVIIKNLITVQDISGIFSGGYHRLSRTYLAPWSVFEKADLEYFERRLWLEEQINAFLERHSHGYFIIEAEAGVGKTAFLAELVKRFGFVHHFVELAPGQAGIVMGLMNLTAQLIRACLSEDKVEEILHTVMGLFPMNREDNLTEPVSPSAAAYSNYLLDLLNKVAAKHPGEKIILVVDGLDIAGTPPGQNVLGLPCVLPEGVFVIVSHRPVSISLDIHPKTPWCKVQLMANSPDNLDDMRRYLRKVIKRPAIQDALSCSHCTEDWFVEAVVNKCAGVWIYTQYIIYEIEKGTRAPVDLTSLPFGMPQYYARYWKEWRNQKDWYTIYLPVLGMLAAARKTLCANDLLSLAGLKIRKEALHRLLNEKWRDFVTTIEDHCYKFSHATLYDFCEGLVREHELSPEDQALINELKLATMEHALQIARKAKDIEMRRDAALTLAKVRWFDYLATIPLQKQTTGIPSDLYTRLCAVLATCGVFASDAALRAIFADERITPWRDRLPEAHNPHNRIRITVDFLSNRFSADQHNALVLFLYVLVEQIHPGDACYDRLVELANELEHMVERGKINAQMENVLVYLDLAGGFLATSAERCYIVEVISSILQSQQLLTKYEIHLHVHRAINYGYLGQLDKAAADYRKAWQLIETKESLTSYSHTAARIFLGAGNIDREKGSQIDPQKDPSSRTKLLNQARNSYLQAAKLAEDYGRDLLLIITIYIELSWCYALLRGWKKAEQTYHKALDRLTHVEDPQARVNYKARALETGSNIHWERGEYTFNEQHDAVTALNAYQRAYDIVQEELDMLKGVLGEIDALTIAYLNAGDYQLAISKLPDCSGPQSFDKACKHWQTALSLAQAWGLLDLEQEAQSRLEEHTVCPKENTSGVAGFEGGR
ncbi:MAG: hypothetical protein JXA21_27715 [Anaerolineae bacterium]|nr:hypothetical protein [Anaerolineae bacterium]